MCYPYGIHAALVRVDRETGGVTIERLFIAYDVGRSVNPMLVDGQLTGGAAQGIGGALLEEFVYDETGQPLAASFADYLMPTAPRCRRSRSWSPRMRRARSTRSASRAPGRAASPPSARPSPMPSTMRSGGRARP